MAEQQQNATPFEIKKVCLKDASLESPQSPLVFTRDYQPKINVEFNNESSEASENVHEVVVRVTVTCTQEDKTVFICEVKQAGVFELHMPAEDKEGCLAAYCPSILFPYASQQVCQMIVAAGFPPVVLPPINFEALYAQRKQQEAAAAQAQAPANS